MKALLCPALLVAATTSGSMAQAIATNKYISFLNKFRQDHAESVLKDSPAMLEPFYADSIRLMPPFQKTMEGKKAAVAYYKAFTNRFIIHEFSKREIEILDLNKQLMEIGTLTLQITSKDTGKKYRLIGKYMDLWHIGTDANPLLLTEIWNFDESYGDLHDRLRFDDLPTKQQAMLPNVPVTNAICFELAAYNRLLDATVTQHDAATWGLYYSDDAILMSSYYPMFKGRKAINDYIESHVKELPVFEELDIRNDRIDHLGRFTVEYASHIASWKNDGSSGVSLGKNIRIWRREADHSLKMFRSIGNYD